MHLTNLRTCFSVLLFSICAISPAFADEDPLTPLYEMELTEPKVDLSATPLAGKFFRYGYHTFWEVNKKKGVHGTPAPFLHELFFYDNGECEWFAFDIFEGESARQPCGTVEVAPNIYQVNWLETATRQVVTMVVNLNTWTVNSSFHFNSGKGLALFQAEIFIFGSHPIPPVTVPEKY